MTPIPGSSLSYFPYSLAVASNGRTYAATTFQKGKKGETGIPQFFSIGPGETAWKLEPLAKDLADSPSIHLYGSNGNELVLWRNFQGDKIIFARAE